jgi:hypothetical protein
MPWKKSPTSVIFKKLPKEDTRPLDENSPNLVTLVAMEKEAYFCFCVDSTNSPRNIHFSTSVPTIVISSRTISGQNFLIKESGPA